MSIYNLLFGKNPQSAMLLAVVGLRENDIDRFRDVSVSADGKTITVTSRTGGGNRDDYPNTTMRSRPEWRSDEDDDFDSTYAYDTLEVPAEWVEDVRGLSDLLEHGMRKEFAQHLAKTLRREPTEDDKATSAYEQEGAALKRLPHFMANGHTFVPQNDHAMEEALKLAEANGGKLRSCWGIAPIAITVKQNFKPYPNAKPPLNEAFTRIEIGYDFRWTMDVDYWKHCQARFGATYPLTMAKIQESVDAYMKQKAA